MAGMIMRPLVLITIVAIAMAAIIAAAYAERTIKRTKKQRAVFGNLDSAFANGYFEPNEQLHGASADEIAYDMTCYAPEFETARPETLTPYVRKWMQNKGLA